MSLQDELLQLEARIRKNEESTKQEVLLLHTKAHMFHNDKMHKKALELFQKYNIKHIPFDDLDKSE